MLRHFDADAAITYITRSRGRDDDDSPRTPIDFLYYNGAMEERLSRISKEYFNHDLTLQRLGARPILRIGTPDAEIPPINRPTREYADAEAALDRLEEQGHGMRSFLGTALQVLIEDNPILLIDEPEAYLHPPQRRSLGRLVKFPGRPAVLSVVRCYPRYGVPVGATRRARPRQV